MRTLAATMTSFDGNCDDGVGIGGEDAEVGEGIYLS